MANSGTIGPSLSLSKMNYAFCTPAAILLLVTVSGCSEPDRSAPDPVNYGDPPGPVGTDRPSGSLENRDTRTEDETSDVVSRSPRLAIDPEGLRWFFQPSGTSRSLAFGSGRTEILASLEPVRGPAVTGTNADCGAGPAEYAGWPDGLSLLFQDGRFAGWGLDSRASGGITTADGIGIGSTRSQLAEAMGPPVQVRKTTLGTEFSAGEYHGLFETEASDAKITDLWAGVSCVAR